MQTLGNFQKLAQAYRSGRRGFDEKIFEVLIQQINGLNGKRVLDVGCGTGIATRQLAQLGAEVVGSDISDEMIAEARQDSVGIEYVVNPSHKIPFTDGAFDLITAFSAFHWFTDSDSINEIKRVLKSGGSFAVINKNDVTGIRKDVNELFAKYRESHSSKQDYNPEKILEDSGFEPVVTHAIASTEIYTPEQALIFLQSIALWNLVPENEKEEMLRKVKSFCGDTLKQEGVLKREIETVVVIGLLTSSSKGV